MKFEQGMLLYAKCDCMKNFKKGQAVIVDELYKSGNISIDGVVQLTRETVEQCFTDKPITSSQERFNSLQEAAQPLIDFLNKNYDPMTIAIIREDRVDIFRSEMGIPLKVKDGSEINER